MKVIYNKKKNYSIHILVSTGLIFGIYNILLFIII